MISTSLVMATSIKNLSDHNIKLSLKIVKSLIILNNVKNYFKHV